MKPQRPSESILSLLNQVVNNQEPVVSRKPEAYSPPFDALSFAQDPELVEGQRSPFDKLPSTGLRAGRTGKVSQS